MSRRQKVSRRKLTPDPLHGSPLVTRFINNLMYDGKKSTAEHIFYDALELVEKKTGKEGFQVFQDALKNVKPTLEVKSRRIGGATYQVPLEVSPERKVTLAIRWMISFARKRHEHGMTNKLAMELIDAHNGVGASVKKREDTHRMAEANKAFAHFRV
ncbi:MAG: 30S ribosomal protein S7 [Candidatus Coatesbacteria bacterium]|nr:30S ribosomal protein S7 [Candidatus Coatesbacteria bacterium]